MRVSQILGNKFSNIAGKTANHIVKPLGSGAETAGKAAGKVVVGTAKFCMGNYMGAFHAGAMVVGIRPALKILEYGFKILGRKDLAQIYKKEQDYVTLSVRNVYKCLGAPKSGLILSQPLGNILEIIKSI